MQPLPLIILCLFVLSKVSGYLLDFLNVRHARQHEQDVPEPFIGFVSTADMARSARYLEEHARLSAVASAVASAVFIVFVFGGFMPFLDRWVVGLGLPFPAAAWVFFVPIYVAAILLAVPFSLWDTFRLEHSYGFNATTPGLWLSDFAKSTLLSLTLFSVVVPLVSWMVSASPTWWWLWVWAFLGAFTLFVMYISPYVIEPLFNVFSPVEDEELKAAVIATAEKVGIKVSRVLKMDASRRSRHSNAYFTGIGRTKRVVLFDTLVDHMERSETVAVLAHEFGHWKRHHLLKSLVVTETVMLAGLYIAFRLMTDGGLLGHAFGTQDPSLFSRTVLVAVLASIVAMPVRAAGNYLSRRFEREADRFALGLLGTPDALVSALARLSRENLANLHPHPFYAAVNYSHPPIVERIQELQTANSKS